METSFKFIKNYLREVGNQLLIIYMKNAKKKRVKLQQNIFPNRKNNLTLKYVAKDVYLLGGLWA